MNQSTVNKKKRNDAHHNNFLKKKKKREKIRVLKNELKEEIPFYR